MKLGRKIRDIRVSRNMTQKKLAESAGISNTYLSDIERMRTSPSIKTLGSIADSLGKDIKEFLD